VSRRLSIPIALVAAGLIGFATLVATSPEVDRRSPEPIAPVVRTLEVVPASHRFSVVAHGTVESPIDTQLRAQVDGEVIWVSEHLAPGGFYEAGEHVVTIDPTDYEDDLEATRAARDRAASSLSRARREHERQQELASLSAASVAHADEARDAFRAADAALREARVQLARAERNLERTKVVAPYAGRTLAKRVDIGQFVRRGDDLAELYAIEYAEVPLPIPDSDLAFLDLPHPFHDAGGSEIVEAPRVRLRARFAGISAEWMGRVVRTAAEIDPRSRTVTVVARVDDPYGRMPDGPDVPLPVGLFVEATIEGRSIDDAVVLPSSVLHEGSRVYVVDDEGRLRFRTVEVLRARRDEIVVGGGLRAGERVVVTPLHGAVERMRVRAEEVREGSPSAEPSV